MKNSEGNPMSKSASTNAFSGNLPETASNVKGVELDTTGNESPLSRGKKTIDYHKLTFHQAILLLLAACTTLGYFGSSSVRKKYASDIHKYTGDDMYAQIISRDSEYLKKTMEELAEAQRDNENSFSEDEVFLTAQILRLVNKIAQMSNTSEEEVLAAHTDRDDFILNAKKMILDVAQRPQSYTSQTTHEPVDFLKTLIFCIRTLKLPEQAGPSKKIKDEILMEAVRSGFPDTGIMARHLAPLFEDMDTKDSTTLEQAVRKKLTANNIIFDENIIPSLMSQLKLQILVIQFQNRQNGRNI